jgi:DNA processing protein
VPVSPDSDAAPAALPGAWPADFVRTGRDRDAVLMLSHLESLTPRELHRLALGKGSASRCLAAVRAGAAGTDGDRDAIRTVDVRAVREATSACGGRIAFPGDGEYPVGLKDLTDPPACLFLRGRPLVGRAAIAVVGARLCSPYGLEMASTLAAGIAAAGVTVVSGAALGIDAAAHRGALRADGDTVAVLGSGIDVPYPRGNRRLIDAIAEVGTVVSEYPPGTPPVPRRFPARNRIVAALARAVLVVEGATGSGSILTAEFAVDLGRDVLAVPGPVTSPLSEAPHALIRDGAALVRGVEDVLAVLGIGGEGGPGVGEVPGLSEEERRVFDAVTGTGLTLESVAAGAGVCSAVAMAALVELELRGLIRAAGGRYERTRQEIAG